MNEQPQSGWKKPLKTPAGMIAKLFVSSLLGIVIALAVLYLITAPKGDRKASITTIVVVAVLVLACATLFALVLRRFCHWRNLRRLLVVLGCLATLIGFFYTIENWRGQRAWTKFKREWEAKGEKFEPRDFIPAPVPDDQNFALTPLAASSYAAYFDKDGHEIIPHKTNVVNRLSISYGDDYGFNNWPDDGDWTIGIKTDLAAWQRYYRDLSARTNLFAVPAQPDSPATDVLLALSKYDSTVQELREAARLPYSRFPLTYDNDDPAMILLPHLASLKRCSRFLQLRASAELQNGQSDRALADVKLCLRLVESVRTEPLLISHLVRIAMAQIAIQPIYEGIAGHRWSDAQLAELSSELAKLDFLADYRFSMRGDMEFIGVGELDYLERTRKISPLLNVLNGGAANGLHGTRSLDLVCWLLPAGWFRQNQVSLCRFWVERGLPLADLDHRTVSPSAAQRAYADIDQAIDHPTPYNVWQCVFLPMMKRFFDGYVFVKKYAHAQSLVDMTRVACTLERFKLATGQYPETVDAVAPRFIEKRPHDLIGGKPLHYRRTPSDTFVLYSVGWNETDDGGQVALTKERGGDWEKGDWVWSTEMK